MKRSFVVSLLLHAAALAAAWSYIVPAARPEPVRVALVVRDAVPLPAPEPPLTAPGAPDAPARAAEPAEALEPEAPEWDEDAPAFEVVAPAPRPTGLTARVRKRKPAPPQPVAVTKPAPRKPVARGPSRGPRPTVHAGPTYPARARRFGWEGRVVLRVLVDTRGAVTRVETVKSSGHDCLDRAAARAARAWRFEPALKDGRRVTAWFVRAVRFELSPGTSS